MWRERGRWRSQGEEKVGRWRGGGAGSPEVDDSALRQLVLESVECFTGDWH